MIQVPRGGIGSDILELPPEVVKVLGGGAFTPLKRGGSGALLLKQRIGSNARFVKYQPHSRGAVDGHTATDLLLKAKQAALIRTAAPFLASSVPSVRAFEFEAGVALSQPFISGRSFAEILLVSGPVPFGGAVRGLLASIAPAYAIRSSIAQNPEQSYQGRASRRLSYLLENVGRLVSGGTASSTADMVAAAAEKLRVAGRNASLLPTRLFFPVHGDLNLYNVIESYESKTHVLVDPRGVLDDWDPVYDVGKMVLSVWIQAGLEHKLYWAPGERFGEQLRACDTEPAHLVCRPRHLAALIGGYSELKSAVSTWSFAGELAPDPSLLWARVLFAAAVHAVCEAACRISVALIVPGVSRREEYSKALLYLAMGSELLEQVQRGCVDSVPFPRASR